MGPHVARGRGVAWLTHCPVKAEIAGSNPVGPAKLCLVGAAPRGRPLWEPTRGLPYKSIRLPQPGVEVAGDEGIVGQVGIGGDDAVDLLHLPGR